MTSADLYALFRSDVVDAVQPYLWSDTEVYAYMNDAYRMFVRLTGGIADFTSTVTQVAIVAGQATSALDPSILRIMGATRLSDGLPIKVLNYPDLPVPVTSGIYGASQAIGLDATPGPVNYMVIGMQRDVARWVQVPTANDTAQLFVYRMPTGFITAAGQPFTDVAVDHHIHFLDWMKHLAYKKQDAETFDRARSNENEASFRAYCAEAKAEIERYKHKTRIVAYGGL